MATRKLFVLMNNVWDANDWLNDHNCNPKWTDIYLYATAEQAEQKAKELDVDDDIYNDGTIYEGELSDEEILQLTGYETIEEFDKALAEPYSTEARVKNLGEDEKGEVAAAIIDNPTDERPVDCANYDFDRSLEGAVLVFWSWERYIGYARKLIEIRRADSGDTEAILTKEDNVFATQCDVLIEKQELEGLSKQDRRALIEQRLGESHWKWTMKAEAYIRHYIRVNFEKVWSDMGSDEQELNVRQMNDTYNFATDYEDAKAAAAAVRTAYEADPAWFGFVVDDLDEFEQDIEENVDYLYF